MAKNKENTKPSILEIIESRRWKRALFTSFTLSLTYFESYVLPRLRKQGCRNIDIYVDALGHRDSLMEQRSRGAGRDYSVIPIVVRGGIFHPKLVHLWAEGGDDDLLLVGSGNLTYSGHGGNIEVVDAICASHHSGALREAAVFFEDLLNHGRIDVGSHEQLQTTIRRLKGLADRHPNISDVQFVHSLHTPGLNQLASAAQGKTVEELLVLSPYHNPEGTPVRELLEAVKARKLLIGLDPNSRTSPFPFESAKGWGVPVAAVRPQTKTRDLHAKWYEVRCGDESIVMTGSFNATVESLASTNNVECGILRRLPTATIHWEDEAIREFVKQVFPRSNEQGSLTAIVSLQGLLVQGRVLGGNSNIAGIWKRSLQTADGPLGEEREVAVDAEGNFVWQLDKPVDVMRMGCIQVRLERNGAIARGWVTLPYVLNLPPQSRSLLSALGDFESGAESADDFASLLSIVMDEIHALTGKIPVPTRPSNAGGYAGRARPEENPDMVVPVHQYAQTDENDPKDFSPQGRLLRALGRSERGWAVLEHLGDIVAGSSGDRPLATGKDGPVTISGGGSKNSQLFEGRKQPQRLLRHDPEDEDERQRLEKSQKQLLEIICDVENAVNECRCTLLERWNNAGRSNEENPNDALQTLAQLERTWLRVLVRAYVGPIGDVIGAVNRLGDWLHHVADISFTGDARELLLPEVAGAAAVLAKRFLDSGETFESAIANRHAPTRQARVAQYLEYFYDGPVNEEEIIRHAEEWLSTQIGNELVNGQLADALLSLKTVLEQPTPRARVNDILKNKPATLEVQGYSPLPPSALALLKQAIKPSKRGLPYVVVDIRNLTSCPACRAPFHVRVKGMDERRVDPTLLADLKLLSVAKCPSCGIPIVPKTAHVGIQ